jgi:hypothetical protein
MKMATVREVRSLWRKHLGGNDMKMRGVEDGELHVAFNMAVLNMAVLDMIVLDIVALDVAVLGMGALCPMVLMTLQFMALQFLAPQKVLTLRPIVILRTLATQYSINS